VVGRDRGLVILPKFSKVQPNGAVVRWRCGKAGVHGATRCSAGAEWGAGRGVAMLIAKYEP